MCVWGGGGGGMSTKQEHGVLVQRGQTLQAALNATALSEAGPRWGGRLCVCVGGGGGGGRG